jgi:hypothetical protein
MWHNWLSLGVTEVFQVMVQRADVVVHVLPYAGVAFSRLIGY